MEELEIEVILDKGAKMPTKAHDTDSGFDIYGKDDIIIDPGSCFSFATGVHMLIPEGYTGFLKSKSGLNVKSSITGTGVIDAGYTGEIVVKLYNNGVMPYQFNKGDKIIQIVILPIPLVKLKQVEELKKTSRAANGFGSSGK